MKNPLYKGGSVAQLALSAPKHQSADSHRPSPLDPVGLVRIR